MSDSERVLVIRMEGQCYRMSPPDVAELAVPGPIRPVPLAPTAVLGISEWRGTLLTVIDLPRVLGEGVGEAPPSLILLAEPFRRTALFVSGSVQLERVTEATTALDRIAPAAIVEAVEHRVRTRPFRTGRGAA